MPYSGGWNRAYTVPYSGATVWGTGYNPVHEIYGSPPDRLEPLRGRYGEAQAPRESVPEVLISPEQWGYTLEDDPGSFGVHYDDRPSWAEQPDQYRGDAGDQPSWTASGSVRENFRARLGGAYRTWRGRGPFQNYQIPSETVSEGWLNKPHELGAVAISKPSDPSQYEMQTSMQQRFRQRNNDAAVARGTDEPRERIDSLVTPQKVKKYSEGERHYDMYPREQEAIPRAFWYRTAGTGDPRYMAPNAVYPNMPLERIPPPDPYIGDSVTTETDEEYGYTPEDLNYA